MKTLIAFIFAAMLIGAAPTESIRERMIPPASTQSVRFTTIDIKIDPQGKPLAAYQIEFLGGSEQLKLVGIEGGDAAAFAVPPYYDPAALSRNRVILAAFNTGADLPKTAFRVARLHVQIAGELDVKPQVKLIVASAADGSKIPAIVTLSEGAER